MTKNAWTLLKKIHQIFESVSHLLWNDLSFSWRNEIFFNTLHFFCYFGLISNISHGWFKTILSNHCIYTFPPKLSYKGWFVHNKSWNIPLEIDDTDIYIFGGTDGTWGYGWDIWSLDILYKVIVNDTWRLMS